MPSDPPAETTRPTGPGFEGNSGRFRRTLVRVMLVQVVALLLLWALQSRYTG